jgi:putative flavoprotein involved in K+ transport
VTALHNIDTVVIGAGHAGLAVSRLLTLAGREHVVLDRGRVGERWRTASWDSLHLLTPNWMTRLPGWYAAGDPDAFVSAGHFVRQLEQYASSFDAPVVTGTAVTCLTTGPSGAYDVHTDHTTWRAGSVVVAAGPHGTPLVPASVGRADVPVITSNRYRNPRRLDAGGVLVVGASSSGVQIADELARSGRDVVLAVGRHTRVPRRYRGMDLFWWLETTGRLARTIDEMPDPAAARREPSMQLIGRSGAETVESDVDLAALQRRGVRLTGRLQSLEGSTARFGDEVATLTADADRRMHALLDSVDRYVDRAGLTREVLPPIRPAAVPTTSMPSRLDLRAEGIRTVVLATGYCPDNDWIDLPVKSVDGAVRQIRGVTDAPGVYIIGQRFQHRRDSGFIDGARHDAYVLVHHLTSGEAVPIADDRHSAFTGEEPA